MTGEGRDRRAERAARREARWTRPRQPRDWRFWIGGLGRVLIVLGLLMFGFVGYQLWGTGLEYSQAQSRLDTELDELLAQSPGAAADAAATTDPPASVPAATTVPGSVTPGSSVPGSAAAATTTPPTTATPPAPMPAIAEGDAFARIEIPTIDVNAVVVAGVAPGDLKQGPGHYPGTPMPGQLGNSAIAGHRTTYGQPFFRLDEMQPGEQIVLTTVQGRFVYEMTSAEVVPPDRGDVVLTKDPTLATLTLTTCDPKWTATNRLIVYATLVPDAVPLPPDLSYGPGTVVDTTVATTAPPSTAAPGTTPVDSTVGAAPATTGTDAPLPGDAGPSAAGGAEDAAVAAGPAGAVEDAFAHGWFSDTDAIPQVVLWGLVVAAIAIGGYLVARAFRRTWVGLLVAVAPFLIALYFFYQNVNRLLPAAL